MAVYWVALATFTGRPVKSGEGGTLLEGVEGEWAGREASLGLREAIGGARVVEGWMRLSDHGGWRSGDEGRRWRARLR